MCGLPARAAKRMPRAVRFLAALPNRTMLRSRVLKGQPSNHPDFLGCVFNTAATALIDFYLAVVRRKYPPFTAGIRNPNKAQDIVRLANELDVQRRRTAQDERNKKRERPEKWDQISGV